MEKLIINNIKYNYKSKYHTVEALKGISYAFEVGKFYAIIGRSGSGKTTLLSLLAALDLPTEGIILWNDTPTSSMDRDFYRRNIVTTIYQNYNLLPFLTVLENVAFQMEINNIPFHTASDNAKNILLAVGLDDAYFNRIPAMLSGGEQQRVAIARALASNAKIILADEPTGNLDTENSDNIITLLQKLARENDRCVIVVTHDMSIADKADEVLRLSDGYLLEG